MKDKIAHSKSLEALINIPAVYFKWKRYEDGKRERRGWVRETVQRAIFQTLFPHDCAFWGLGLLAYRTQANGYILHKSPACIYKRSKHLTLNAHTYGPPQSYKNVLQLTSCGCYIKKQRLILPVVTFSCFDDDIKNKSPFCVRLLCC